MKEKIKPWAHIPHALVWRQGDVTNRRVKNIINK